MERKRNLPVGMEFFDTIRREERYYVDKTGLIAELLRNGDKVNLFTRPRRFGKTLMMTTLQYFFEYGTDASLFEGLAIAGEQELCEKYMGQYPVIFMTLKDIDALKFENAKGSAALLLHDEMMRHEYLLDSPKLSERQKRAFEELLDDDLMQEQQLEKAGRRLCEFLEMHHGKKVIVILDEYDVPLAKAYEHGYYDEMVSLIRGIFANLLKTNTSLEMAVLTGCLRISKESIFTGLNNLKVWTIADEEFGEGFGFTGDEVRDMLAYYGLQHRFDTTKEWYDGYRFGSTEVYCPWDVVNFARDLLYDSTIAPKNYWANSSGNDLLIKFVEETRVHAAEVLESLIAGEIVDRPINQEMTYRDLNDYEENVWSILYMTGYLTIAGRPEEGVYPLVIPNREIRNLFTTNIMKIFSRAARDDEDRTQGFAQAFLNKDPEQAEERFNQYLAESISIRDTSVRHAMKENFYHGYLMGLLQNAAINGQRMMLKSNRESGEGYADILLFSRNNNVGIVIEVKYAQDDRLDEWAECALRQIAEKDYDAFFAEREITNIIHYGIACYKKHCKVKMAG